MVIVSKYVGVESVQENRISFQVGMNRASNKKRMRREAHPLLLITDY